MLFIYDGQSQLTCNNHKQSAICVFGSDPPCRKLMRLGEETAKHVQGRADSRANSRGGQTERAGQQTKQGKARGIKFVTTQPTNLACFFACQPQDWQTD